MAKLTLYPRPSLGTLASSSPGAEATTTTGWTVGTNPGTPLYKAMEINAERSASGWVSTPPTANPTTGFDTLESDVYSGKFAAENWAALLKAIAVTSGGDQDGAARVRLWRTKDKVTWTALTAAVDLSTVTNLATGAAQATEGVLAPGEFTLTEELLGLQIWWKITGAGGAANRDVLFREGSGITLVTANFTPAGGSEVKVTAPPAIAVASAPVPVLGTRVEVPPAVASASAPAASLGVGVSVPPAVALASAPAPVLGKKVEVPAALAVASAPSPGLGTGEFVRRFDGAGDAIVCEVGHCDTATSAFTMAFLMRRAVNGAEHTLAALHSHSEKSRHMAYLTASNKLGLRDSVGNSAGGTPFDWAGAGPVLAFVTKPAGLALPRFHRYVLGTETFTHEDGDVEIADAAGSSETIWLGGAKEFGSFNGDMAAAMVIRRELDDSEIEDLVDIAELVDWLDLPPDGLWLFNQDSTEDLVIDYTYGHADAPAVGILGTAPIGEDPPIPYGTPPGPPTGFRGDFETGDTSQFESMQAIPERLSIVTRPSLPSLIRGRYGVRTEVQAGDEEPATGSQRAELISGLRFYGGEHPYFRVHFLVEEWDFEHWGMLWQIHDNSSTSPPLALQIAGTEKAPLLELVPYGKNKERYWQAPFEMGEPTEAIIHPFLSDEGSIEVWLNRIKQTLVGGDTIIEDIPTLGVPMSYDKVGPYRSKDGASTAVVFYDDYWVGSTFPPPIAANRLAIRHEFPSDKIAVEVSDSATGDTLARLAEDEADIANVIAGLKKSGEMPGGYNEASWSMARDPRIDHPDIPLYGDVTLKQAGREIVWEGRIDKVPKSDGERLIIDPVAVGWQRALEDDKGIIGPGFINADLGQWGDPSGERRKVLIKAAIRLMASTSVGFSAADPTAIAASLINDFTNVETIKDETEAGEAHFHSAIDIGRVIYDALGDIAEGEANADWESNIAVGTTDTFTTAVAGTDHNTAAASGQKVEAPGPGYKYARIRNRLNAASEEVALKRIFAWQPRVVGNHGLTLQGAWPNVGFTAAQMLAYAIPLYASPLTVKAELLEDDGYVIPHAWFADPGPMSEVVKELTKYGLYDWFVFGGKVLQLRAPGSYGRRWQAYAGPSELKEAGLDGERLWESIVVAYQDVDGSTRTVGPPGSGADVQEEGLRITDPDHPAVRAQVTRQDVLSISGHSTPARATEAGERWLKEANELSRSGSATLKHYVLDDCAIFRPAAQVQPGDHVRFPDAADRSYRKVVAVEYEHDSRTATVTLDAPPEGYKALLERMQADLRSLSSDHPPTPGKRTGD